MSGEPQIFRIACMVGSISGLSSGKFLCLWYRRYGKLETSLSLRISSLSLFFDFFKEKKQKADSILVFPHFDMNIFTYGILMVPKLMCCVVLEPYA